MIFAEATGWFLFFINVLRGLVFFGSLAFLLSFVWLIFNYK